MTDRTVSKLMPYVFLVMALTAGGAFLGGLIKNTYHDGAPATTADPTPPQRMEVISSFQAPSGYTGTILRDRETGEEYMTIHHGGAVHLVKPSTTPKP